jgi:cation:H+ antiporter
MLVTLALALIGLATGPKRGWTLPLRPELSGLTRDLGYFLVAYVIAFMGLYVPQQPGDVRALSAVALVLLYICYVYTTVQASSMLVTQGHGTRAENPLHLVYLGIPTALLSEVTQLAAGLVFIIAGAKLFVLGVEHVAAATGIGALVISLVIIPIATEMPEKFNSILWVRRGKDTLAFGNVTGAMVFQGTLLPAFGMQLGAWLPSRDILWAMGITFASALWTLFLAARRRLTPAALLLNGVAYLLFFLLVTLH